MHRLQSLQLKLKTKDVYIMCIIMLHMYVFSYICFFVVVLVSWTCRGRIRARNTPVRCKSVYEPTTTRNRGARLSSRNCVGAAPGTPEGRRPCARDGRKKRKRSRSWGPGPSEAVPGHSLLLPVSLGLHFLSLLQAW